MNGAVNSAFAAELHGDNPDYQEPHNRGTSRFDVWGFHCAPTVVNLRRGEVGPRAREVFRNGHCHSFALAAVELVGCGRLAYDEDGGHVFAVFPVGEDSEVAFDVRGECPEIDPGWLDDTGNEDDADWLRDDYKRPRVADAMPFAAAVLNENGYDVSYPSTQLELSI